MITFILPIYQQEHVLEKSISALDKFLSIESSEEYEILICNDGSADRCSEIAEMLEKKYKGVRAIGYKTNRGRGYALKYSGLKARGEYLISMDCDLIIEENFPYIRKMISLVKDYDVVIATRFHPQAKTERKFIRKFVSRSYRLLVRLIFPGFPVTDPDVGFKGFKKESFQQINLVTNLSGPPWDLQFLINSWHYGHSIYEFPFSYNENYTKTTVNIFICSLIELMGMLYIRLTFLITKRIVF